MSNFTPITHDELSHVQRVAAEWASRNGEESPTMRIAATDRYAASMALRAKDAPPTPDDGTLRGAVFLVIMEGDFALQRQGSPIIGPWAAIIVTQESFRLIGGTVRPRGYIPPVDLASLGPVYER
jgi:hypothetical protein